MHMHLAAHTATSPACAELIVYVCLSLSYAALESNNSRLMWYTMLEIGTLALMYVAQSFFLHKWFSDRGMLAKRQWA